MVKSADPFEPVRQMGSHLFFSVRQTLERSFFYLFVLLFCVFCSATQGPWAEAMMHAAMESGQWVFFQNCHLAPSWMPSLERLIENIEPTRVRTLVYGHVQMARCDAAL